MLENSGGLCVAQARVVRYPSLGSVLPDVWQNSFRLTDQNSKWHVSTELSNPQGRLLNTKIFALIYPSQVQRKGGRLSMTTKTKQILELELQWMQMRAI